MAMANDPDGFDSRIPVAQRQGSMAAVKERKWKYFVTVPGCRGLQGRDDRFASRDDAASGMGRYVHSNRVCKRFFMARAITPYPIPGYRAEGIDPRIADVESHRSLDWTMPSSCRVAFATALMDSSASLQASATFSMRSSLSHSGSRGATQDPPGHDCSDGGQCGN
jgi:hypothetical protein